MKKKNKIPYSEIHPDIKAVCENGTYCTHCGRWAQKYRKVLGEPVAKFLIKLYVAQQHHDRYYTTRELYPGDNKASTEGVIARFWGLIDVADTHNSGNAPVGSYHLTDLGRRFVMGVEHVKSHAYTYNSEFLGLDGHLISIRDALGKKFNYDDLMAGR